MTTHVSTVGSWSSGPREVLGYRFELVVPRDLDFVDVFGTLLRDFAPAQTATEVDRLVLRRRGSEAGPPFVLLRGSEELWTGASAHEFTGAVLWNLNQEVISTASDRFVLLHAACVVRAGVTVVLPAEMESGKSTTTAGLLRDGFDYVTDEATALDPTTLTVHPFLKPVTLDPGSWFLFPELAGTHPQGRQSWQVPPGSLGASVADRPVAAPDLVIFPAYRHGSTTQARRLRAGEATMELCRSTFAFAERPRRCLDALANLTSRAACYRLTIGDLDAAVTSINDLVSSVVREST